MATADTRGGIPAEPTADDRIVDAIATERIRVATELRDGALQALTGLSLQLASAIRRAGADADHLLAAVAEDETMLAD
ncbi:MAG: hypothetical protein ACYC5V_15055, partial [Gemmatimonadaceae bacterium]